MTRRFGIGDDLAPHGLRCPDCGESMPSPWCSQQTAMRVRRILHIPEGGALPVVHCEGPGLAWCGAKVEHPHHGRYKRRACWHCYGPLGCDQCVPNPAEVLCTKCLVWGTRTALLQHGGPLTNHPPMVERRRGRRAPDLSAYPAEWQQALRRERAGEGPVDVRAVLREMGQHLGRVKAIAPLTRQEREPGEEG